MKKLRVALLGTFSFVMLFGMAHSQEIPDYEVVASPGDSLRESGDMTAAVKAYRLTYFGKPEEKSNLYNFACALSITRQYDSCFKYLNLCLKSQPELSFLTDPDFLSARNDKRWAKFENDLISLLISDKKLNIKDIEYAKVLWAMEASDQAFYDEIHRAETKIGRYSTVVYALWDFKRKMGKENQKKLEELIAKKGWPKISDVGNSAADAAFLVIQHADIEKQTKYLPIIKKACEEKEAKWDSYALMYDRIQTNNNKPQKYGSQVKFNDATKQYELFPLEDASKVDQWRKDAGMMPLADYVAHWNIKLDMVKK